MRKKIVRPKKRRTNVHQFVVKNYNNSAIRSAPNLSTFLNSVSDSSNNNSFFIQQNAQPRYENSQPIRWITTGDGEEIPMRAVYYYSPRSKVNHQLKLEKTDPLDVCAPSNFLKLFFQKCRICCYFCDYSSNDFIEEENKKIKLDCLQQLLSLMKQPNLVRHLNNDCLTSLMHMITINIFRPVCSVPLCETTDYAVDLEWDHIGLVYNLFVSLININSFSISQIQIKSCIRNLFLMFRMPDKREQQSVGRCLSEICRKYQDQRPNISSKCTSFLTAAQYDISTQKSLPIFLEFYLHTIAYLKPKNPRSFILMNLFPLVILKEFENFHATHLCIIEVFIQSDPSLVDGYLLYLLNHWPIRSPTRTTLFLNAVHEIVSKFHQKISVSSTEKLLAHISNIFCDCTAEVSQQALFMLMDEGMTNLILSKGSKMIHTLFVRVLDVCENHWLASTRTFAADALSHLKTIVPPVGTINMSEMKEKMNEKEADNMKNWAEIKRLAKLASPDIEFADFGKTDNKSGNSEAKNENAKKSITQERTQNKGKPGNSATKSNHSSSSKPDSGSNLNSSVKSNGGGFNSSTKSDGGLNLSAKSNGSSHHSASSKSSGNAHHQSSKPNGSSAHNHPSKPNGNSIQNQSSKPNMNSIQSHPSKHNESSIQSHPSKHSESSNPRPPSKSGDDLQSKSKHAKGTGNASSKESSVSHSDHSKIRPADSPGKACQNPASREKESKSIEKVDSHIPQTESNSANGANNNMLPSLQNFTVKPPDVENNNLPSPRRNNVASPKKAKKGH